MPKKPPVKLAGPSVLLAVHMANEYFEIGASQYNKFAQEIKHPLSTPGQLRREHYLSAVAAGTLLSFSIELYLKVLLGQYVGEHPAEHRIDLLAKALPKNVFDSLGKRYNDARQGLNLLAFDFTLGDAKKGPAIKAGSDSFEQALSNMSDLFVRLRYFHENFSQSVSIRFDFFWLFQMVRALQSEISAVKGGQVVSFAQTMPKTDVPHQS